MVYSGVIEHTVNNIDYFENVSTLEHVKLTVTDRATAVVTHVGEVLVHVGEQRIRLRTVYYVPSLNLNILYCLRLDDRGISTFNTRNRCAFYYRKERSRYLSSIPLNRK